MVLRKWTELLEALAFFWLFVLVWSSVLGHASAPDWNSFVMWAGQYVPDYTLAHNFFGRAQEWYLSLTTLDIGAIQTITNGDLSWDNFIQAFGFLFNLMFAGLPSIFMAIGVIIDAFIYLFGQVIPMVTGFVYFLSGNYFVNVLPGALPTIDWSAMSGEFGYPDPLPSWSFDPSFLV